MEKFEYRPEYEKAEQFRKLREAAHQQVVLDSRRRVETNPYPTAEEIEIGRFGEMLEPQVRDAIFQLNKKGHYTHASGFWGKNYTEQAMVLDTDIDLNDLEKLKSLGASVGEFTPLWWKPERQLKLLTFSPRESNLETIKEAWDKIADVFPDKGKAADRNFSVPAIFFRHKFASDSANNDIAKIQQIILSEKFSGKKFADDLNFFIQEIKANKFPTAPLGFEWEGIRDLIE